MKTLTKPQKAPENKWTPVSTARTTVVKLAAKPRSLSQPTSGTTINKQIQRPFSGGAELLQKGLNKSGKLFKLTVSEEQSEEDEKFESATLLNPCTDQLQHKDPDPKVVEIEVKTTMGPVNKPSSSGIPLRVRRMNSTQKTTPAPRKTSPRIPKPNANSTYWHSLKTESPKGSSLNIVATPRRLLEAQFQNKKKKVDQLKKEIFDKQKPLMETYQALLQIKKKLEETGKTVSLEEIKMVEFKNSPKRQFVSKSEANIAGDGDDVNKPKIDPETVQNMNLTIKQIPNSLLEICKNLITKRLVLVELLEKTLTAPLSPEDLQSHVDAFKYESTSLEKLVKDTFMEQEKLTTDLVQKWQTLLKSSGDYSSFTDQIEQLQERLQQKEDNLAELTVELDTANKQRVENASMSEQIINDLKEKVKSMEGELRNEKMSIQDHKDKNNLYDQRMKLLKTRLKELETKQKEAEVKCVDLQKLYRHAQDQLKASEHRWAKEKEDILTKHKHDRQMLDKLTKDRSYFETRMKTLEELIEDKEAKFKVLEVKSHQEIEQTRQMALEEKTKRDSMQQKYDEIKDQLVQMEIRNKQAIDLVHSKNTFEPNETEGIATEREAELYTELLATRVALKAAEDQIQNYNREKLRFIDSIQSLQGEPDKDSDYIAKTLIKNVEKITELESKLTISEDTVCGQKIEIANLKIDIENLKQRQNLSTVGLEDRSVKDADLKLMLHEGRIKLEQSLKKSLEFEHKIIRYEHDINKQGKQICEMENLLKVRDGLISMMKAKKDELQMENDSLSKYANEIRDLLIQAREEARNRTELIQELSSNLETRGRTCKHLEKKVKDLEGSLSATNEKRFKLQDMIGSMEKELQSTKAQLPAVQSRYDAQSFTNHITPNNFEIQISPTKDTNRTCISEPRFTNNINKTTRGTRVRSVYSMQQQDSKNVLAKLFTLNVSDDKEKKLNINEVEAWMRYYRLKLKYLKTSLRAVSNTMFERDMNVIGTTPSNTIADNLSLAVKVSRSFTHRAETKSEMLSIESDQRKQVKEKLYTSNIEFVKYKANNRQSKSPRSLCSHKQTHNTLDNTKQFEIPKKSVAEQKHLAVSLSCSEKNKTNSKVINLEEVKSNPPTHRTNLVKTIKSNQIMQNNTPISNEHTYSNTPLSTKRMQQNSSLPALHIHKDIQQLAARQAISSWQQAKPPCSNSHIVINHKKVITKSESESSLTLKKHKYIDTFKTNSNSSSSKPPQYHLTKERKKFINHANNISNYLKDQRQSPNNGKQYVPKLLEGINQYNIIHSSAPLVLCTPCTEMEVNGILFTHDLMAKSLSKINANITSSLKLLEENFPKVNSDAEHKKEIQNNKQNS